MSIFMTKMNLKKIHISTQNIMLGKVEKQLKHHVEALKLSFEISTDNIHSFP